MVKVDKEGYEYKTVRPSPIHFGVYDAVGHKFAYVKRRRALRETKYSGFKAFCTCKWRSTTWYARKELAQREHWQHIKDFKASNPSLEGVL